MRTRRWSIPPSRVTGRAIRLRPTAERARLRSAAVALQLEDLLEGRPVRRREGVRQQAGYETGACGRLPPLGRVCLAKLARELVGGEMEHVPERGSARRQ